MPSWSEIEAAEPDLAATARGFLDAHVHKTLATLRRDGSPRLSGTEVTFKDGDLWLGSMPGSYKARDLQRDPRFSLHSGSDDPPAWNGDARVSGRVVEITDPDEIEAVIGPQHRRAHLFRADIAEVVVVSLNDARDRLVIDSWVEGRGRKRVERE